MKIIKDSKDNIAKVWGKQKTNNKSTYRMMKYVIREDVSDGILLHNVVTGELVLSDNSEAEMISKLPTVHMPTMDKLIERHFLVEINYDEHKAVDSLRKLMRAMNYKSDIVSYTILPTSHCNARCFYCYESELERNHMSEETADKIVTFICNNHGDSEIELNWFGGEPTLGAERINRICKGLEKNDVRYHSKMTSNGYLFTPELVKTAKEFWKLKSVQITIDGTEEIYNSTKAYVGVSDNPYKRVINNINNLAANDIRVCIRLNIGMHNLENIELLTDQLLDKYKYNSNVQIYLHKLFEGKGFEPVNNTLDESRQLTEKMIELQNKVNAYNYQTKTDNLVSLNWCCCMADNKNSLLIDPLGELYKCEHIKPIDCIGNIEEGIIMTKIINDWQSVYEYEICKSCELLPHCMTLEKCDDAERCNHEIKQWKINECRRNITRYYDLNAH